MKKFAKQIGTDMQEIFSVLATLLIRAIAFFLACLYALSDFM